MNIPRLKRMVAVLEEVEAKHAGHFDIDVWAVGQDRRSVIPAEDVIGDVLDHKCGSAACALGWFYAIEKQSLWLVSDQDEKSAAKYFDLTDDQTEDLFMGYCYTSSENTPRHVINRIRKMIGEGV